MLRYILCFWLLAQHLHAQPGFNIGYPIWHLTNHFHDVVVNIDTLIAYGTGQDSTTGYKTGLLLAKFDTSGNLLSKNIITPFSNNAYAINKGWGKIIATSDGGYAMTAGKVFGRDGVFVKVDRDLQVEFVREYVDTVNLGEFLVMPFEIPDGYLLCGYYNKPGNAKPDGMIRKVDKQGHEIWRKTYGTEYDQNEVFFGMTRMGDSLFALSGLRAYELTSDADTKPWLCIVDTSGTVVFEWKPQNVSEFNGFGFSRLFPNPDGTWLALGSKYLGIHPQYGWDQHQNYWGELDEDFHLNWLKPFGPNFYEINWFADVLRAPNGDLIGVGERGPFDPDLEDLYRKGWVMRFTAEGDSLWEWTGQMPLPGSLGTHCLSGGALLSSGSIVAAGQGDARRGSSAAGWSN